MCVVNLFRLRIDLARAAAALIFLPLLAGCGKGSDKPVVYPVSGELFVQGKPASGALVVLRPADDAEAGNWARGFPHARVEADGTFQIESYEPKDGAPVGTYKVLAQWQSGEDGQEEDSNATPRTDLIPASYFDATTTPWTADVKPQANRLPRFEIP
jgi:hypothetical protein